MTVTVIFASIFIVPTYSWPLDWLFFASEPEKNNLNEFVTNVASEWTNLELKCDKIDDCAYFIDSEMRDKYSNLYVDKCSCTSLNGTVLVDDPNSDYQSETKEGTVIALKTLEIPSFEVDCYVHFNDKEGNMVAKYMIKGSNQKSSKIGIGMLFETETKKTNVFMSSPKEDLEFRFTAR